MKYGRMMLRAVMAAALMWSAGAALGAVKRVGQPAPLNEARQPTAMQRYIDQADAAIIAARQSDENSAAVATASLSSLIDDPFFTMLPRLGQRMMLSAKATATWRQGDPVGARDLFQQATRIDGNDPDDWYWLAILERNLGDQARSARYMTALVNRWPELVNNLDAQLLGEYVYQGDADAPWRIAFMQALFDAGWDDRGNGVDDIWRQLALAHLDDGNVAAAARIVERISSPLVIIRVRSDKRFDALSASVDALPTAREAAERRVVALRRLMAESPERLDLAASLGTELLVAGRHEEALAAADAALAAIAADPSSFETLDDKAWVMNNRAIALRRLGRLDEALAEIERASQADESADQNVSQVLNLASFYCHLERPQDALRTLERVGRMSGYGRMVLSAVQHCAALQTNNRRDAAEAFDYMLAHRKDSEAIVLETLLSEGRLNAAAQALIGLLADANTRDDALRFVQKFQTAPELAGNRRYNANRRALLAREDVMAAVDRVGRMGVHEVFDVTGIE